MGEKAHLDVIDSPKAEVGEIDTRAPIASVKAAVSLFGEVASSPEKSVVRKPRPQSTERLFAKETELHLAQKELNKLKDQLKNAETTRVQALAELEKAKRTVEDLTHKLKTINDSKELAIKATETAKFQSKNPEELSCSGDAENGGSWKNELENAREQYAVAITELDVAKQELRALRKNFEASINAKVSAFQQEADAKQLADVNQERATQLSNDIAAMQVSLSHLKLAATQAQQEKLKVLSEKDACRKTYKFALEENEIKLAFLKKEFNPELARNLEDKLAETSSEIGVLRKDMENARGSDLNRVATVTSELDGAKGALQKVAEEEGSLRSLMESLKLELESVKKEHLDLREKEVETESITGTLELELQKNKVELEMATVGEGKARAACSELLSALEQLSIDSEKSRKEADAMNKESEELRKEAESARIALQEAEKKLQVALRDAEEAKAAEANALNQIRILSGKANTSQSSTPESGVKITISAQEFESLNRKVEESHTLAELKVAAAVAQVEALKAGEKEAIKRLEAIRKEIEEMEVATEEALKRAEMAEAARKAVQGEMRRWREREQKKAAEVGLRILVDSQVSEEATTPPLPPKDEIPKPPTPPEKNEWSRKMGKPSVIKKPLLPNLSGIFHRKKNQVEGGMPSYLPGEEPI